MKPNKTRKSLTVFLLRICVLENGSVEFSELIHFVEYSLPLVGNCFELFPLLMHDDLKICVLNDA